MSLFIGFIIFLVINLVSHKVDLESEDYYQKEIDYESEIVAMNNGIRNQNKPIISSSESHIVIQLNDEISDGSKILFRRPDNNKDDKTFSIGKDKTYIIEKSKFKNGKYEIELSYSLKGKNCLQKETIFI